MLYGDWWGPQRGTKLHRLYTFPAVELHLSRLLWFWISSYQPDPNTHSGAVSGDGKHHHRSLYPGGRLLSPYHPMWLCCSTAPDRNVVVFPLTTHTLCLVRGPAPVCVHPSFILARPDWNRVPESKYIHFKHCVHNWETSSIEGNSVTRLWQFATKLWNVSVEFKSFIIQLLI